MTTPAQHPVQSVPSGRTPVLAVVIPSYRVAPYIAGVIREIPDYVAHIFVVDDRSPDDIAAALREVDDPRVHYVRHEQNRGVGGAVKTGYAKACEIGADIFIKVDGDGQMDPARIPELIEPIVSGRADYAKGNRFIHAHELRSMPPHRRLGNTLLSFMNKAASGYWHVFDPANGYTALHRDAWLCLDQARLAERYFFETSLLIELGCARAVVEDVALPARYQGEVSSLSPVQVTLEFPPKLLAGLLRRIQVIYFLQDFTPVSLFLLTGSASLLFATLWGGYYWRKSILTGVASPTGTVMLAVVALVLGVQLLLQALAIDVQNVPRRPIQRRR
ncbi:MAG: glycosyltransferase family 2 protein [Candidatus Eisenbacteria bacterium]|nr:glycosyltransferase family 2 protein [Candidatus Eisenbacteria bacterium]